MSIRTLDNIGIVVQDLAAATSFFVDLGMTVMGSTTVEGPWVDKGIGLDGVRADITMLQAPDGHGRVELSQFHSPPVRVGDESATENTLGIRRIAFTVDDIDVAVTQLTSRGVELVGEVVKYEEAYRYCYVRGPEGILVMLAQELR
jgi:catechol 2,3-dioxygenase-like lactoylglutathione lyase family enzyme